MNRPEQTRKPQVIEAEREQISNELELARTARVEAVQEIKVLSKLLERTQKRKLQLDAHERELNDKYFALGDELKAIQ